MTYQVITPYGTEVELTFVRPDKYGGIWFTDGTWEYFAHNPMHPDSTDPVVCLSYDYTII
jgi:hypothetical protein